ncbi:MAG: hypothetical protein GXO27_05495 [Chlorobi bacterium]|nr:hypothetical protein [Chlorobiota bacterium]
MRYKQRRPRAPRISDFHYRITTAPDDIRVTFYWKTARADRVELRPFRKVKSSGRYTVHFYPWPRVPHPVELRAENTATGRIERRSLTLFDGKFTDRNASFWEEEDLLDRGSFIALWLLIAATGTAAWKWAGPWGESVYRAILWGALLAVPVAMAVRRRVQAVGWSERTLFLMAVPGVNLLYLLLLFVLPSRRYRMP